MSKSIVGLYGNQGNKMNPAEGDIYRQQQYATNKQFRSNRMNSNSDNHEEDKADRINHNTIDD